MCVARGRTAAALEVAASGAPRALTTQRHSTGAERSALSTATTTTTSSSSSTRPDPVSRRVALGGLAAAAGFVAIGPPSAEAAAGACELQSSPSGLQWCDIQEGDGPLPIKGAFYK